MMNSNRPYITRAIYEWILDNDCTPYIIVNSEVNGVQVPRQFVQNGQIILNISPKATNELTINNSYIQFTASFQGKQTLTIVPIKALIAIYATENNQGMFFDTADPLLVEEDINHEEKNTSQEKNSIESQSNNFSIASRNTNKKDNRSKKSKNHLHIIK